MEQKNENHGKKKWNGVKYLVSRSRKALLNQKMRVNCGVDIAANGPLKALTPSWRAPAGSPPRRALLLVALRFRELGLVSRDRECNLQLPSARPVTGYATTCECTPEPRSGVGADGSGRLSTERGRGPSEIGPDPTARLPRKLGRGTPALRRRRGRSTLSPVCGR